MARVDIVVQTVGHGGGGVAVAVHNLLMCLRHDNVHQIRVLTQVRRGESRPPKELAGFPVLSSYEIPLTKYGFSVGLIFRLLRSDADLVHVHGVWSFQCLAVYVWSIVTGRPYVVTPHGMLDRWILKRSPFLKRMVSWLYQDSFLARAAAIHVLNAGEMESLPSKLDRAKVKIAPNYVGVNARSTLRPRWWGDAFDGRRIILFFGRIDEKKGWAQLLDAWDALCRRSAEARDSAHLVFAGWLDNAPGFEKARSRVFAMHSNVHFIGSQFGEDKFATLKSAHAIILPSHSEGLPMAILEAWACGTPSIMTPECNLPVGFATGAAVQISLDPECIATRIQEVLGWSEQEREVAGAAASSLVRREFSFAAGSKTFNSIYDAISQKSFG